MEVARKTGEKEGIIPIEKMVGPMAGNLPYARGKKWSGSSGIWTVILQVLLTAIVVLAGERLLGFR